MLLYIITKKQNRNVMWKLDLNHGIEQAGNDINRNLAGKKNMKLYIVLQEIY